jgi:hypothetical protein
VVLVLEAAFASVAERGVNDALNINDAALPSTRQTTGAAGRKTQCLG